MTSGVTTITGYILSGVEVGLILDCKKPLCLVSKNSHFLEITPFVSDDPPDHTTIETKTCLNPLRLSNGGNTTVYVCIQITTLTKKKLGP